MSRIAVEIDGVWHVPWDRCERAEKQNQELRALLKEIVEAKQEWVAAWDADFSLSGPTKQHKAMLKKIDKAAAYALLGEGNDG